MPPVNRSMVFDHVQSGLTAFTRIPLGVRSIAWLRFCCRIAALDTG